MEQKKEKIIKVINFILLGIRIMELDRKLERKYVIKPQFPNKKMLKKIEEALDKKFVFDVPGIPLRVPLRRLMAKTKLHKDELIRILDDLKINGAITAMDTRELQKPEIIDFNARLPIDVNKEKLIQYKNNTLKGRIVEKDKKILYLNEVGDLFRKPKEKYCYQMNKANKKHKIILYFAENEIYDYYPTNDIALDLDINRDDLRKEIGKLDSIIRGKLYLGNDKLLNGRRGSGYRINPKYKIVPKNE